MASTEVPNADAASVADRVRAFDQNDSTPDEALKLFEDARAECPVSHCEQLGGFYMLVNYEDVKAAASDWETFSNEPSIMRPASPTLPKFIPNDYDPPEHTHWRRLFKQAISPKMARDIQETVRAEVNLAIDEFAPKGSCDLVPDLAVGIPLATLCHILGIEREKGPELIALVEQILPHLAQPENAAEPIAALAMFGMAEIESRKQAPRGDFLSELSNAEIDGRKIEDWEAVILVVGLLMAGAHTVSGALSSLLHEVLTRPGIREALIADPGLIPAAVDESLRLHPPNFGFFRRATKTTTVGDVEIPEGESVYCGYAAANRDPAVWSDPLEMKLDRKRGIHSSMTFGYGPHACPGQPIAKMEMRVAVEELLRRLPDMELVDPEKAHHEFVGSGFIEIHHLPVTFPARS